MNAKTSGKGARRSSAFRPFGNCAAAFPHRATLITILPQAEESHIDKPLSLRQARDPVTFGRFAIIWTAIGDPSDTGRVVGVKSGRQSPQCRLISTPTDP